jgi:ribosomal protein L7/L12
MKHSERIKEAIRILHNPETNHAKLLLELALNHPTAFLKASHYEEKPEWKQKAESFLNGIKPNKVEAIKVLRSVGGIEGLKEAKDTCEYYMENKQWPT